MLQYGSGRHQADLPHETVTTFIKVSERTKLRNVDVFIY
jgi:hypothetical protein